MAKPPILTYAQVMGVLTEYMPDVAVIAADAFITELLELQQSLIPEETPAEAYVRIYHYDGPHAAQKWLVKFACNAPTVLSLWQAGQKIQAIKELRVLTSAHLKEAKEACEHPDLAFAAEKFHAKTEEEKELTTT